MKRNKELQLEVPTKKGKGKGNPKSDEQSKPN